MGISSRRNFNFSDIPKGFSDSTTMREVGNILAVRITNRTLSGLDENGRKFHKYSKAYAARKVMYGGGRSNVDLHVTGAMLNNLGPMNVSGRRVEVGFPDPEQERMAAYHDGPRYTSAVPRRKFMGIPADWINDVVVLIKKRMRF